MFKFNFSVNFDLSFTKISHQLIAAAILCALTSFVIYYTITKAYEIGDNLENTSVDSYYE